MTASSNMQVPIVVSASEAMVHKMRADHQRLALWSSS